MTSLLTEISLILGLVLLERTKTKIRKAPAHFVIDGIPVYMNSSKKIFGKKTNHIIHIRLAGKKAVTTTRWSVSTVKSGDREKVFRGLKGFDALLIAD